MTKFASVIILDKKTNSRNEPFQLCRGVLLYSKISKEMMIFSRVNGAMSGQVTNPFMF